MDTTTNPTPDPDDSRRVGRPTGPPGDDTHPGAGGSGAGTDASGPGEPAGGTDPTLVDPLHPTGTVPGEPTDPIGHTDPDPDPTGTHPWHGGEDSDTPPTGPAPRRLHRSRTDRMLAGVSGGVAEYFDIDTNLVRIAFVLSTIFVGIGAVAYVAGWLLLPEDAAPAAAAGAAGSDGIAEGAATTIPLDGSGRAPRKPHALLISLVVVGIAVVVLAAGGPWWIGSGWHPGLGVGWIVLAVLAYLILRPGRTRFRLGRILATLVLLVVGCIVALISTVLVAEALTGVPLRGGVGSQDWHPSTAAQIHPTYRVSMGELTLDLRQVALPTRTTSVTASVGIGKLRVVVPPGVTVSLSAHSGIGNVSYGSGGQTGFLGTAASAVGPFGEALHPELLLNADVGIGQVELIRAAPGTSLDAALDGGSTTVSVPKAPTAPGPPPAPKASAPAPA